MSRNWSVQFAHQLGGFDVDRVLFFDFVGLVADDEGEAVDVFVQVFQGEFMLGSAFIKIGIQIIQSETRKIGHHHVAWQVALFYAGEVIQCLTAGAIKVFTARFMLNQQHAFPQQIDITVLAVDFLYALFKGRDTAAGHAEDI